MGILLLLAFVVTDEPVLKNTQFDYVKKVAVFADRDEVLVVYCIEFFEEKGPDNISKRGITYKYRHYVNSTKKEQEGESVVVTVHPINLAQLREGAFRNMSAWMSRPVPDAGNC